MAAQTPEPSGRATIDEAEINGPIADQDLNDEHRERMGVSYDSIGRPIELPAEQVGTVAGNTTAAGATVGSDRYGDHHPSEPEEDLGPGGTIIQEVGGEARH